MAIAVDPLSLSVLRTENFEEEEIHITEILGRHPACFGLSDGCLQTLGLIKIFPAHL
jgi:hypothetical protein